MRKLYLYHPVLNCLYFEEDSLVFEESYDEVKTRIFKEFLEKFWNKRVNPTRIVGQKDIDRVKGASIESFSLAMSLGFLNTLINDFQGFLYGSKEPVRNIHGAVRNLMNKKNSYDLCRRINPTFLHPGTRFSGIDSLEKCLEEETRLHRTVVVKANYGKGGKGSSVISSQQDIVDYLGRVSDPLFKEGLEIIDNSGFIVEPYFNHTLAPSIMLYLYDSEIVKIYSHDREERNLRYFKSRSPSRSEKIRNLNDFCMKFANAAHFQGYRGPLDFEFMEDNEGNVRFCEVNARFPISFYPSFYPIKSKPYILEQYKIDRAGIFCFDLFMRIAGEDIYDLSSMVGVIPMNIPHYKNPLQEFSLLFVGNDNIQLDRMHEEVSTKIQQINENSPCKMPKW